MCRIAGIASRSLPAAEMRGRVAHMCFLQRHGGPDDEGIFQCPDTGFTMGHRRLSLFDLSACGHQPMIYNDRYIISFNGEIYNFSGLKVQLQDAGMSFHTQTDTEVILAAFACWGERSFARLSGMFAFALYDRIDRDLYLVRDPSGMKPLYYYAGDDTVVFASEMRALSAAGDREENSRWPVFQLAYGFLPEPVTTLQGVMPLPKGCFYKINLDSYRDSFQSFAHYSFCAYVSDRDKVIKEVKHTLTDSVKRHLLADAPVGVFLSGGIDSGILTMLSSPVKKEQLKTLSLYFSEKGYSEKIFQDIIIAETRCNHFQHLLTEEEFHRSFEHILSAMDMPSCDGINTWFISKYARELGLKAVLSGIGGDELFGGYPSFERMAVARKLQLSPRIFLKAGKKNHTKGIRRLPYLSIEGIKGLYLYLRGQYMPYEIAAQLDASEKEIWDILKEQPGCSPLNGLSAGNEAGWMEMHIYMQSQLLRDADVMSMAHGIEIRMPFLDPEVIRTALTADPAVKFDGPPKKLLVDAFKEVLPREIWDRKKMGFSFPFTEWFGTSRFIEELMEQSPQAARKNYHLFKEGKLHWSHLMSLIILQTRTKKIFSAVA